MLIRDDPQGVADAAFRVSETTRDFGPWDRERVVIRNIKSIKRTWDYVSRVDRGQIYVRFGNNPKKLPPVRDR